MSVSPSTGNLTATTNYFPRAIISRHKVINADFCMPAYTQTSTITAGAVNNAFYASAISGNGDSLAPYTLANAQPPTLPNLPRSTTPSINIYLAQQERFEYMRRRFYTQVITTLHCPWSAFGTNAALN